MPTSPARPSPRVSVGVVAIVCLALAGQGVSAQTADAPAPSGHSKHGAPTTSSKGLGSGPTSATAADVASPEAIVAAYYESLSGPAGKKRDKTRFLSLFLPGARLLPAEGKGHSGTMPRV